MNWYGLFAGAAALCIIGIFHPIVIKGEYHFGKGIWPLCLICGLALLAGALAASNLYVSILMGIAGSSCLWSIKELFEQEKRVKRGWFPKKPGKKNGSAGENEKPPA
ncbi:MAG: DUF4491 family protein [Spirochaetaceae bacterium]|nr:DUF4491 family protein [Spirochaetaceae bacterium]